MRKKNVEKKHLKIFLEILFYNSAIQKMEDSPKMVEISVGI